MIETNDEGRTVNEDTLGCSILRAKRTRAVYQLVASGAEFSDSRGGSEGDGRGADQVGILIRRRALALRPPQAPGVLSLRNSKRGSVAPQQTDGRTDGRGAQTRKQRKRNRNSACHSEGNRSKRRVFWSWSCLRLEEYSLQQHSAPRWL